MINMTNTKLKIIALVTMLMDHVWLFFPESTPVWFHMVGRLSAPIFIYCCVLGYTHTHNKRKYIGRLYSFGIMMMLLNCILFESLADYYLNFIRTLFLVAVSCFTIETFKEKNRQPKQYLSCFWTLQIVIFIFELACPEFGWGLGDKLHSLILTMVGSVAYLEGGIFFVILGIFMFLFKDSKWKLSAGFIVLTLLYIIAYNTPFLMDTVYWICWNVSKPAGNLLSDVYELILGENPAFLIYNLYEDPQWMMIFSIPLITLYNGDRGKGYNKLFYLFYPAHIIILSLLA